MPYIRVVGVRAVVLEVSLALEAGSPLVAPPPEPVVRVVADVLVAVALHHASLVLRPEHVRAEEAPPAVGGQEYLSLALAVGPLQRVVLQGGAEEVGGRRRRGAALAPDLEAAEEVAGAAALGGHAAQRPRVEVDLHLLALLALVEAAAVGLHLGGRRRKRVGPREGASRSTRAPVRLVVVVGLVVSTTQKNANDLAWQ